MSQQVKAIGTCNGQGFGENSSNLEKTFIVLEKNIDHGGLACCIIHCMCYSQKILNNFFLKKGFTL